MKKIFSFLFCFASAAASAQAPQGIPYQAIARNASGQAIASTAVKVRFSIRDSIATGAIKYQETHNPTTSALGLFSLNVGTGTVLSGNFSGINWGKNAKFLQVELNTTGGTAFTDLGTTQMMSVPYALYAGNVNGLPSGGIEGQSLSICGGVPTWTTNGVCPGHIGSLNCAGMQINGQLFSGFNSNFTITIPYSGGNGGPFSSASFSSTGVTGVTASLAAGYFNNGSGNLTLSIVGTPSGTGNAQFQISIGAQSCNISLSSLTTTNPVDIDGNMYQTVTIGNQVWFKENLKVSKYRNGDGISTGLSDVAWAGTNNGAYCIYNNNPSNNTIYGKLYNWYTVADPRGLCPTGWHVPTDHDWNILIKLLDSGADTNKVNDNSSWIAGGVMKTTGTIQDGTGLWNTPNGGASNQSGFSGLPGGFKYNNSFSNLGGYGYFWSSTLFQSNNAFYQHLDFYWPLSRRMNQAVRTDGLSVRCLKN